MPQFPSLSIKMSALYAINGSVVLLVALFQLAAWYPFISQTQSEQNRHLRLRDRTLYEWEKTERQAKNLQTVHFKDAPWAQHAVESSFNSVPTTWSLEGVASIAQWQTLLERVEAQCALGLQAVDWQRQQSGHWKGRLLFDIKIPKANRDYHNWLPTKLRATQFIKKDWQLLSTMRSAERASALVTYKHLRRWVQAGSWLPRSGVTVSAVSFNSVTLMAKDGSLQTLVVRDMGDEND